MKRILSIALLAALIASLLSCKKNADPDKPLPDNQMESLSVPASFNWSTSKPVTLKITALDNLGQAIKGAKFGVYTKDPVEGGSMIVSGITNNNGVYTISYQVPSYYESLFIATDYVGLVNGMEVALGQNGFDVVFGGATKQTKFKNLLEPKATNAIYKFLGAYDNQGVPAYLEPENDPIDVGLLDDINASLPEKKPLPVSHPEFFSEVYDHNVRLLETCDVWVTFVTEGAGYKNVLGFYTYPTNNPPATPADIDSITIIFPNASLEGSGGGLQPGNKVKIGRFNANTTIAWALMADGWKNGEVTNGRWTVYSTKELNQAYDPELNQQTVLLRDPGRSLFLLGIEDIKRTQSGCDHDFNDAIFYVTANPVQAVDPTGLPVVDYTGDDVDGDEVPDQFDDFPNDPDKAFNNYFFNQGDFGTMAFEDLWPYRGDYDFNDAVIDYNFNQITNGDNEVVEIIGTFILRAHGAFYHNGFGLELPISPESIEQVSGQMLTADYIQLAYNGTEAGQPNAVIIIWDDSYEVLPPAGNSIGANTTPDVPFILPDTIHVTISLTNPLPLNQVGIPPYNPFLIVNKDRAVEVHLPDKAPTALADQALLGTGHDNSIPAQGRYYKTQNNLPWAINIIERFEYPIEKVEIPSAHLKFADWAESGGQIFNDWFRDEEGYRNPSNIYIPSNSKK